MEDDGDIVRGLGCVVMYAAHLEGRIENLLIALSQIEPYLENERRLPISKKIKKAKNIFSKMDDPVAFLILRNLEACEECFEWRNELVHGRIYSPEFHQQNHESGRPNIPNRRAESSELYLLANNLDTLNANLCWPLSLPNLIFKVLNNGA